MVLDSLQRTQAHVKLIPVFSCIDGVSPPFTSRQRQIGYDWLGIKGPCCAAKGAKRGRSGLPDRMVATPFTSPASSLDSFIRFCISFIESIIKAMNSSHFSVNAANESPAEVFASFDWGSAASFELLNPVPLPSRV